MQIGAATMEKRMDVLRKIKNGTALHMTQRFHSLLGISEETQNTNSKEYINPYVHCSIIYNGQTVEVTHVPMNRKVVTYIKWNITWPLKRMESYHLQQHEYS